MSNLEKQPFSHEEVAYRQRIKRAVFVELKDGGIVTEQQLADWILKNGAELEERFDSLAAAGKNEDEMILELFEYAKTLPGVSREDETTDQKIGLGAL